MLSGLLTNRAPCGIASLTALAVGSAGRLALNLADCQKLGLALEL